MSGNPGVPPDEQVDVAALLHSLADVLRRTLDFRIRVAVEVAANCPPCFANAGLLESALLDLVVDARNAMPEGGTLSFSAKADRDGWVAISVSVCESGRDTTVTLSLPGQTASQRPRPPHASTSISPGTSSASSLAK